MLRRSYHRLWLLAVWCCGPVLSLTAAQPIEQILPATTKAFVVTPSLPELRQKFNETQFGALVNDEAMKPFVEDLKQQMKEKLAKTGTKLGVELDDLEGIAGEVSLAALQPLANDKNSHAIVFTADITDKQAEADALLAKISKNQAAQGTTKSVRQSAGVAMTMYTLPQKHESQVVERVIVFTRDNLLVATDNVAVADDLALRIAQPKADNLASLPAFQFIQERFKSENAANVAQIRWYVDPFGYAEVTRAMAGKKKRGTDMIKLLAGQGFSAVKALGGSVFLATGEEEVLHRTYVYAPSVRKPGEKGDKYNLAARMLEFPNTDNLQPQAWVPEHVAGCLTFNWKMQKAFNVVGTLVDAIAGEKGVFDEVLLSLKNDPNGPKVDVRAGLAQQLKERATMMTDYHLPIKTDSERWLVAVEVNNDAIVADTVKKAFEHDPTAKRRVAEGHVIWEIIQDQNEIEAPTLTVEGAGFVTTEAAEPVESSKLPNSAITVWHGHLIVASHVDAIVELLKRGPEAAKLTDAADFKRVQEALTRLGAGSDSFRHFSRTSETTRPTYELLQQGKMPEAETLLAKGLNALLAKEGESRQQQINGSKLPEFDVVRKYLGPTGLYVRSEESGWAIVGCALKQEGK